MRYLLILLLFLRVPQVAAQDTLQRLEEVTVHAFEQRHSLQETPAAINYVSPAILQRYGSTSIVNAVNSLPGVRMEERSPGSYRLNIRGSSLRSPFGVRNVKIYYNGLPFTDPGGTTYLNQLGTYNISALEIVKGPGSSIYGAGTGGVALIESIPAQWQEGVKAVYTGGSYGLVNALGEVRWGRENMQQVVRYQHLSAEGYREHSAMRRDVLSWDAVIKADAQTTVDAHFLYSDLAYETPGALTLSEYDSAPKMARPGVGATPGAVSAAAAIYQKTFLAGFTVKHRFSRYWDYTATLYGVYSQLYNPAVRNYAKSSEPNAGGRAVLKYARNLAGGHFEWLAGAELQQNFTTQQTYGNRGGTPDTLQSDDILRNRNLFGFTQLSFGIKGWSLTGGLSISRLRLLYARVSSLPYQEQTLDFNNELSPRIALLKSWSRQLTVYATAARGFSPPTTSELSPSGGRLNNDLRPEWGWNYEAGLRGYLLQERLYYDLSFFYFSLYHTIVQRRDAAGGDYYLNSGSTRQQGAEAYIRYFLQQKEHSKIGDVSLWASYTAHYFHYADFKQLDNDYSGNALPGVAPNTVAAGLDIQSRFGLYGNVNYYYSDAFPLNDPNTDWNKAYHILGFRIGYEIMIRKRGVISVFAGGDNLLDEHYTAGPDITAFGGRYYNAAPRRNFYAGISLGWQR